MRKGAAGRLSGCGLKAGMPDILVFHDGITVGIELKAPGGILSPIQRSMFNSLRTANIPVHVCYSIDDVHHALSLFHFPMRPYNYGYPLGHKKAEARNAPQPNAGATQT